MRSGQWFQRWLADDYSVTLADGTILRTAKKDILPNIPYGRWKVDSIAIENIDVRVFGGAAIVTAKQIEKSHFDGKDTSGTFQYTHVWMQRNGQWKIVAGHVTQLK